MGKEMTVADYIAIGVLIVMIGWLTLGVGHGKLFK
jgi:hypothetical protein